MSYLPPSIFFNLYYLHKRLEFQRIQKSFPRIGVQQDQISQKLECAFCYKLKINSMISNTCQHIICDECIKILPDHKECPTCGAKVSKWINDNTTFNKFITKVIEQQTCTCGKGKHPKVNCFKNPIKCQWCYQVLNLGCYDHHIKTECMNKPYKDKGCCAYCGETFNQHHTCPTMLHQCNKCLGIFNIYFNHSC